MNAKALFLTRRLIVAGTAVLLGGCAANSDSVALKMEISETPVEIVTVPSTPPGEPPVTAGPIGGEQMANSAARIDRPAALVGLYGEMLGGTRDAGGPFDGSSNIAQITFTVEGACFDPDIDRTGTQMVFASTQHRDSADIYLKTIPGRTLTQLTSDPADDVMPVFHPSGATIAFASNRAGNWDIYVMSTDGGQPMKVTDDPEHELHPSWSPDGERLIYCKLGSRSGRWEMWSADTKKPGVRRFLDYGLFPQWCPDVARSKILFQRARQRGSRHHSIWTVDYINGDAVRPTEIVSAANAAVINPAWSPDGRRIVFVSVVEPDTTSSTESQQSDVWIVNVDGSGRTNLTNGQFANFQPVWSGDGRVFFVSDRSGVDNVWAVTTTRALEAFEPNPVKMTTAMPEHEHEPSGQQP